MTKKGRHEEGHKSAAKAPTSRPSEPAKDRFLVAVAAVGMLVTGILMWAAIARSGLPYCAAGSGCEVVQNSSWSRFLGVPLAAWGFMAYLALAGAALHRVPTRRRRLSALIATAGFGISIYLSVISAVVIKAYCTYCLISLGLMGLAFALSFRPSAISGVLPARVSGMLGAVIVAGLMHASAAGMFGVERAVDPELRALAEHLDQRGMKFYGASWCQHCQQQKELFGAAAQFLPYVECSPHGPKAARATECEMRDIRNYPTWIVDDRRIERVLPIEILATISGYVTVSGENQD